MLQLPSDLQTEINKPGAKKPNMFLDVYESASDTGFLTARSDFTDTLGSTPPNPTNTQISVDTVKDAATLALGPIQANVPNGPGLLERTLTWSQDVRRNWGSDGLGRGSSARPGYNLRRITVNDLSYSYFFTVPSSFLVDTISLEVHFTMDLIPTYTIPRIRALYEPIAYLSIFDGSKLVGLSVPMRLSAQARSVVTFSGLKAPLKIGTKYTFNLLVQEPASWASAPSYSDLIVTHTASIAIYSFAANAVGNTRVTLPVMPGAGTFSLGGNLGYRSLGYFNKAFKTLNTPIGDGVVLLKTTVPSRTTLNIKMYFTDSLTVYNAATTTVAPVGVAGVASMPSGIDPLLGWVEHLPATGANLQVFSGETIAAHQYWRAVVTLRSNATNDFSPVVSEISVFYGGLPVTYGTSLERLVTLPSSTGLMFPFLLPITFTTTIPSKFKYSGEVSLLSVSAQTAHISPKVQVNSVESYTVTLADEAQVRSLSSKPIRGHKCILRFGMGNSTTAAIFSGIIEDFSYSNNTYTLSLTDKRNVLESKMPNKKVGVAWLRQNYTKNTAVTHEGKGYTASGATLATDIPGVQSPWAITQSALTNGVWSSANNYLVDTVVSMPNSLIRYKCTNKLGALPTDIPGVQSPWILSGTVWQNVVYAVLNEASGSTVGWHLADIAFDILTNGLGMDRRYVDKASFDTLKAFDDTKRGTRILLKPTGVAKMLSELAFLLEAQWVKRNGKITLLRNPYSVLSGTVKGGVFDGGAVGSAPVIGYQFRGGLFGGGLTPIYGSSPPTSIGGKGGITQTFGNVAGLGYSVGGGSRIFMGKTDPTKPTSPFSYQIIDCSDSAHINFDVNIDTLPAGVVFAAYLVPMKTNIQQTFTALANASITAMGTASPLLDEWGLGYGDAQGVNNIVTPEIDLLECTGVGAQFTLHGWNRNASVPTGLPATDPVSLAANPLGMDNWGVWQSVHGLYDSLQHSGNSTYPVQGTYKPLVYGPGTQFQLNTQLPFNFDAILIGPLNASSGAPDTLNMLITLTQGPTILKFNVSSPGFTVAELQNMCYVQSLWSTEIPAATPVSTTSNAHNSWWLDGVGEPDVTGVLSQRSWAAPYGAGTTPVYSAAITAVGLPPTPVGVINPMFLNYNHYAIPMSKALADLNITLGKTLRPVCARVNNMKIGFVDVLGTALVAGTSRAWVLDGQYRGIAKGAPLTNWSGRHMTTYGIFPTAVGNTATSTGKLTATTTSPRGLIPDMLPADTTTPPFVEYTTGQAPDPSWLVLPVTTLALKNAFVSTGTLYVEAITPLTPITTTATNIANYMSAEGVKVTMISPVSTSGLPVPTVGFIDPKTIISGTVKYRRGFRELKNSVLIFSNYDGVGTNDSAFRDGEVLADALSIKDYQGTFLDTFYDHWNLPVATLREIEQRFIDTWRDGRRVFSCDTTFQSINVEIGDVILFYSAQLPFNERRQHKAWVVGKDIDYMNQTIKFSLLDVRG